MEVGEEHYLRVIKANVERLGDAERVIEALREVRSPLVARTVADFDAKWGKR